MRNLEKKLAYKSNFYRSLSLFVDISMKVYLPPVDILLPKFEHILHFFTCLFTRYE